MDIYRIEMGRHPLCWSVAFFKMSTFNVCLHLYLLLNLFLSPLCIPWITYLPMKRHTQKWLHNSEKILIIIIWPEFKEWFLQGPTLLFFFPLLKALGRKLFISFDYNLWKLNEVWTFFPGSCVEFLWISEAQPQTPS